MKCCPQGTCVENGKTTGQTQVLWTEDAHVSLISPLEAIQLKYNFLSNMSLLTISKMISYPFWPLFLTQNHSSLSSNLLFTPLICASWCLGPSSLSPWLQLCPLECDGSGITWLPRSDHKKPGLSLSLYNHALLEQVFRSRPNAMQNLPIQNYGFLRKCKKTMKMTHGERQMSMLPQSVPALWGSIHRKMKETLLVFLDDPVQL